MISPAIHAPALGTVSLYGAVIVTYLSFKLLGSWRYEPTRVPFHEPSVSVIVPEYNEDPELMRKCLDSLLDQTYPLESIYVTDDGSSDTRAWQVVREYAAEHDIVVSDRLPENRGKRHAQANGFRNAPGDVFITVDSDSILEPNAIAEIVKPMRDDDVMAVSGHPKLLNRDENLLMRLVNMRYWISSNVERAAQDTVDSVVCCCGVFSAYRAEMIREVCDEFVNQTFGGEECTFGDDRHLTSYAQRRGKVRYQSTAVVWTESPSRLKLYLIQQTRWMRSFWREGYLALAWAPKKNKTLATMIVADLMLPFLLIVFGLGQAIYRGAMGAVFVLVIYLTAMCLMAYVRSIPYARREPATFLLSPLYGLLYVTCLLPLSFYALFTVTASGWGTR